MNLKVGDKVAVLDAVLKGEIIGINDNEISVNADEMIFKFKASELVKIEVEQHELSKYSDINNSLLQEKIATNTPKVSLFKKEKKEVILEVDLHIQKLVKSTYKMDNYDMLNVQLDVAKNKIEFAIAKRIPKVVFIHGVGEGVLKSELHRLLNKYPVKYYDASYKKYGLGATEIYIYQNSN